MIEITENLVEQITSRIIDKGVLPTNHIKDS